MFRFEPPEAQCSICAFKQGPLAWLGYDLVLKVSRFTIDVDEETESIEAHFDPRTIEVTGELLQPREEPSFVPDGTRKSIERKIKSKILEVQKHPDIAFRSTYVVRRGECVEVLGRLSLRGIERPFGCLVAPHGDNFRIKTRIHQPDFGIQSYRMFFGGLRLRPYLDIELKLPRVPILALEREAPLQPPSPEATAPPM